MLSVTARKHKTKTSETQFETGQKNDVSLHAFPAVAAQANGFLYSTVQYSTVLTVM